MRRMFKNLRKKVKLPIKQWIGLELEIFHNFEEYCETIEKIQNRPQFKEYKKVGVKLPE